MDKPGNKIECMSKKSRKIAGAQANKEEYNSGRKQVDFMNIFSGRKRLRETERERGSVYTDRLHPRRRTTDIPNQFKPLQPRRGYGYVDSALQL